MIRLPVWLLAGLAILTSGGCCCQCKHAHCEHETQPPLPLPPTKRTNMELQLPLARSRRLTRPRWFLPHSIGS